MKKLLLLMASLILGLTACQKDEGMVTPEGEQTITVKLPQSLLTKATADEFGKGAKVNRCIMQIYRNGEVYGERQVAELKTVEGTKTATFQMRLVPSQTYDFVFWSDYATGSTVADFADAHYNTSDLTNVTLKAPYSGNNDEFDAFSGTLKGYKVVGQFNQEVTLTRPFGQLNVKTLDWAEIKDAALQPAKVKVNFTEIPTSFNVMTGEVGAERANIEYTADVLCKGEAAPNGELTVDYIFAPETESSLSDFTMTFIDETGTVITTNDSFTNIPVRRNYRTNVKGNLLTKKGTIKIDVDASFSEPGYDKNIVEVMTVAEVDDALKSGATDVVVKETPSADATVVIPAIYQEGNDVEITVVIPSTTNEITVEYDNSNGDAPKAITIDLPSAKSVVINLPELESTVTLKGTDYESVTATTADNTLIVPEEATIKSLTVKGGNVKLYGVVNALTRGEGYKGKIYRCFSSQKSFDNMVADNVSSYTEILVEESASAVDGKNVTLKIPMTVSADLNISNIKMDVPATSVDNSKSIFAAGTRAASNGIVAILVVDGAENAIFDNVVSLGKAAVRPFAVVGTTAGVTVKNSKLILPVAANKAGLNLHCMTNESILNVKMENTLIGVAETKLNESKLQDYDYTEQMKKSAGSQTRGISVWSEESVSKGRVNLNMSQTVIEGVSYAINMSGCNVYMDVVIEDCILDGRAALNLRGLNGSNYIVNNSKFIGRNWFGGPSEVFATIVYGNDSPSWSTKDQVVILNGSEVVAYSNPQTDNNWQYLADMRSYNYNKLALLNGSKFREIGDNPRLDYLVDITNPDVCDVKWDDTFTIQGKEGATVVPAWTGTEVEEVQPNAEGIYEISKASQLAWVAAQVNDGIDSFEGKTIRLVSDISLYNREWTPIGNGKRVGPAAVGSQFKGTFDGNHKTVHRYTIYTSNGNVDNALGLFGIVNGGTVKDFTIKDVYNDSEMAAAAVGMLTGGGVVSGVEVASGIVEVTRGNGGVVGRMIKSGSIINCINRATIIGKGANVGGIVGAAYYTEQGKDMVIENCKNYGTVKGSAGAVGGIVGLSAADVKGCLNEANITGSGADVAGIVAEQQNAGSVVQCINRGNIKNNKAAYGTGGIIGWIRYNGSEANYPKKNVITVSKNENYGKVEGGNDAGGIVGTVYNLGIISENSNYAEVLKASTFAAGIVGNAQFTETAVGLTEPNMVKVTGNLSTTKIESITAPNKDLFVYINQQDAVVSEGNRVQ